jgi:DUF4097 and DUF4098 domain-containing protein YvlB
MKKIALLIVLFSLVMAPLTAETDTVKKTFALTGEGQPQLEFTDIDGNVEIRAHDKNEIKFEFTKELKGNPTDKQREYFKEIMPKITHDGNSVKIKIYYPKRRISFSSIFKSGKIITETRLWVPKSIDGKIKLVDGNIDARGMEGKLSFHTVDGNCLVNGCKGKIKTGTVDGNITIEKMEGWVQAKAVDGNVDISGILTGIVFKGVDGDATFKLENGSQLKSDCEFNMVDGDIDISIPADLSFKINARTYDGSIDMDVKLDKITLQKKNKLEGSKGSGDFAIDIHTVDGDIAIKEI